MWYRLACAGAVPGDREVCAVSRCQHAPLETAGVRPAAGLRAPLTPPLPPLPLFFCARSVSIVPKNLPEKELSGRDFSTSPDETEEYNPFLHQVNATFAFSGSLVKVVARLPGRVRKRKRLASSKLSSSCRFLLRKRPEDTRCDLPAK